jgi:two-component system response regulator NreC
MKREAIRVLCVDDHEVLLEGLASRIRLEASLELVGLLRSATDLIAEARRCRPDVVVLDIAMPGPDPFEAAADLHSQLPEIRTVFLTAHVRDGYFDAAFRAGAWGYLYKGDSLDGIVDALKRVARGEYVTSPALLRTPDRPGPAGRSGDEERQSKLETLTAREIQILELIGKGLSREEIAERLHRSRKTVDTHRANLMKKLGIHDRTGLALYAVAEGLVDVESVDTTR